MLFRMVLVTDITVIEDPLFEGLADEGVDDVAEVLAGHLADFLHDG